MKLKIIKKILIYAYWTCLVLSILFVAVYFFGARQVGVLEAKFDLWRGRYEIHGYGLLWFIPPEIEALKPYGIEYRHVAGCVINDFIIESVAAYNVTMLHAINRDFDIEIEHLKKPYTQVPDFKKMQKAFEVKPPEKSESCLDETKLFMHTLKPDDIEGSVYEIGDCFTTDFADLDGDAVKEEICLRYLKYKEYDDTYIYTSLVVDIFREKKHVLRHEIDRRFNFNERFVSIKDIDNDGRAELITWVRFSPDCAGCEVNEFLLIAK